MAWFRIVTAAKKKARLDIYDAIGETTDWWTGEKSGLAARDFSAALQALGDRDTIELHINSPGGLVYDAYQIYNELKRHSAAIEGFIDGQAASAASIIAMACDTLTMPSNSSLWVHNPMAIMRANLQGYSDDMREIAEKFLHVADELDTEGETILNTYLGRAGDKIDRAAMKALMDAETTITAERAVELGLADQIEEPLAKTVNVDLAAIASAQEPALKAVVAAAIERAKPKAEPRPVQPNKPDKPPEVQIMEAKAVVAACTEAGFAHLAPAMITAGLTEKAVRGRIEVARKVKKTLTAGALEHTVDTIIPLALDGDVDRVIAHMAAFKREQLDPEIDSHLPPGGPTNSGLNLKSIYAARRKRLSPAA